jgi:ribonuclease HI
MMDGWMDGWMDWIKIAINMRDRLECDPRITVDAGRKGEDKKDAVRRHTETAATWEASEDDIVVYTDGSGKNGSYGFGFTVRRNGAVTLERSFAMGKDATVYDAEICALSFAMARLKNRNAKRIHFASDSRAAILSILSAKPSSVQEHRLRFRKDARRWLDGSPDRAITINWVPGHRDIEGNERADDLAKQGAESEPNTDFSFDTISCARQKARAHAESKWVEAHSAQHRDNWYAACRQTPRTKPHSKGSWLRGIDRRSRALLTQVKTGHAFLGEYYGWRVPSESPGCPCGALPQTRSHVLKECPRYEASRHILRAASPCIAVPFLLYTPKGQEAIVKFIERTGAFTKTGDRTADMDRDYRRFTPYTYET